MGSAPLRAALLRAARVKLAVLNKKQAAMVLWDAIHIYNSIHWEQLCEAAESLEYNFELLVLGAQVHMGNRILRAKGHVSEILGPFDSVLAGDQQSQCFSKAALYDILEAMTQTWPRAAPQSFIDDVPQLMVADTVDEIVDQLGTSAIHYATTMQAKGFVLADDKSKVIPASAQAAAKRVWKRLRKAGVAVKLAASDRDLGVDAAGGRRRWRRVAVPRLAKACSRVQKTAVLTKANKGAR